MSEVLQRTKGEVETPAAKLEVEVIYPTGGELFIDLDIRWNPAFIGFGLPKLLNGQVIEALKGNGWALFHPFVTKSRRGNMHVYCVLVDGNTGDEIPLSDAERVGLQAALGSDPVREALGALRSASGAEAVTVFFETPAAALKVFRWRESREAEGEL